MRSVRRVLRVATPFALMVAAEACQPGRGPNPSLTSVAPEQAYNDQPVPVVLAGTFTRPALAIDTATGTATPAPDPFIVRLMPSAPAPAGPGVAAESIVWHSAQQIDATVPAGLPAGSYDVEVIDRRGQDALLETAFTSLGPDLQAPTLTIQQPAPGAVVGALTDVTVVIAADDGVGHVQSVDWEISSISLGQRSGQCIASDQPSRLVCSFIFTAPDAPTPLESITISATAQDTTGHAATVSGELQVAAIPTLTSIAPSSEGPTTGNSKLVIEGANFIDNVSQILIDGVPIGPDGGGGTVQSDHEMTGTTLPHAAGIVALVVANGAGQSSPMQFQFVLPPVLRGLSPMSGPETGGTHVTLVGDNFRPGQTLVYVDDGTPPLVSVKTDSISASVITITLPPGTGLISIVVVDPLFGQSELTGAFQYTPAAPAALPDGGG